MKRNLCLDRVPYDYEIDLGTLKDKYAGIFISNGPGNPVQLPKLISFIKSVMESDISIPIFGICLGHQIMGLSAGFQVEKLKYGNRGQNIPCGFVDKELTHRTIITSQNHGYAIKNSNLENWEELFRNINDNSNEGICHASKPYFSVQFHPEARGGPEEGPVFYLIYLGI